MLSGAESKVTVTPGYSQVVLWAVPSGDPVSFSLGSVFQDIRVSTASMKWTSVRTNRARMGAPASTL